MSESKDDYSGGDKVNASDVNQHAKNTNDAGGFRDDKNAGETIAGATTPVPLYQNTTDNEFYACDANDTDKLNFVGFGISDSTNGNPIDLQLNGIVRGFTGLDEGEKYYVQDAVGTIGKTVGTYRVLVGIAISTTELLIMKETSHTNGTSTKDLADASTPQNIAHGLGKIPKKIKLHFKMIQSSSSMYFQDLIVVYNGITTSIIGVQPSGDPNYSVITSFDLYKVAGGAHPDKQVGVITVDKTNIIITWTKTGSPTGTYTFLWEAEA